MRLVIVFNADKRRIEVNVNKELRMSTLIMVAAIKLNVNEPFTSIVLRKEDVIFATKEERTLEELNINDGDMLTLSRADSLSEQLNHLISSMRVSGNEKVLSRNIKMAKHAKTLFNNLRNKGVCDAVKLYFPQLATTYLAHPKDLGLFINTFINVIESTLESKEEILNRNVEKAVSEFPECFKKTPMLYLNAHLNGIEVLALVDTGAQSSVISTAAVERCNVTHLVDDRFCVYASGVGGMESSLGRILACQSTDKSCGSKSLATEEPKILSPASVGDDQVCKQCGEDLARISCGDLFVSNTKLICSFDVLPNDACNVDLIIGLDVLDKNQAVLDVTARKIRFRDEEYLSFFPIEEAEAVIPFKKRNRA